MLFFKGRKARSAASVAILASLAFLALAVWGWGVPLETIGNFFLISTVLILGLMLAAVVMVMFIKLIQRFFRRD